MLQRVSQLISRARDDIYSLLPHDQIHAQIAHRQKVYISPHFDDICFSLGDFVRKNNGGVLINVFSNSKYVVNKYGIDPALFADNERGALIKRISSIRRGEDAKFAAECNLDQYCVDIGESTIRGRMPFELAGIEHDIVQLTDTIMTSILARIDVNKGRAVLFCPMGIGGHIDHLVVLRTIAEHYQELSTICDIYFYEDLHYSSKYKKRREGINRFLSISKPKKAARLAFLVTHPGQKLKQVSLYVSQFERLPTNLRDFTPDVGFWYPPHEALWQISQ